MGKQKLLEDVIVVQPGNTRQAATPVEHVQPGHFRQAAPPPPVKHAMEPTKPPIRQEEPPNAVVKTGISEAVVHAWWIINICPVKVKKRWCQRTS